MTIQLDELLEVYEQSIKNFHMLMSRRVKDILIVTSLFDACIINQEARLEDRLEAVYRAREHGRPPAVTWVHSARETLNCLEDRDFDLVITTLRLADEQAADLGPAIKSRWPQIPVLLLLHEPLAVRHLRQGAVMPAGIDQVFVWSHDSDQVMAMIQYAEDVLNIQQDTQRCNIPVILLVGAS
ncbi:MAG: hypothetical protein JJV98_15895, partial [Desulfosarcina sp.]|nr:hypothetical protein [Desulfobacterales bacterium]